MLKAQLRELVAVGREVQREQGAKPLPAANVAGLGTLLYSHHLLPVELGGTLLLVAPACASGSDAAADLDGAANASADTDASSGSLSEGAAPPTEADPSEDADAALLEFAQCMRERRAGYVGHSCAALSHSVMT